MSKNKITPITFLKREGEDISIKIGTTTTDEFPKSVFIRTKIRVMPTVKKTSYTKDVLYLKESFEKFSLGVLEKMKKYDNKAFIFSITVSERGIKYKKKSLFHYDIFLKPLNEMTMYEHKVNLEMIAEKLNEYLFDILSNKGFLFN